MDTLLQDLRFITCTLRKQLGFTAAVVLTRALATGTNTGAFTLIYGILISAAAFPMADRLVAFCMRNDALGIEEGELSVLDLDDLRARCSTCAAVASVEEGNVVFDAGRRSVCAAPRSARTLSGPRHRPDDGARPERGLGGGLMNVA